MTISPEILHKIQNLTPKQQLELEVYLSKLKKSDKVISSENKSDKKIRKAGFFSGKIKILEGFDDPLEDFKDYM